MIGCRKMGVAKMLELKGMEFVLYMHLVTNKGVNCYDVGYIYWCDGWRHNPCEFGNSRMFWSCNK